ncbi:hypothetical protein DID80_05345, partial [Candidatus Marinamargulisbacteria bacterium SCGC AAA071-K20]
MILNLLVILSSLVLASFANMLIYRLPRSLSIIKPRSFCIDCKKSLSPTQLIPLFGFLYSKGKCLFCSNSIPLRYLLVELIVPLGLFGIFHVYGLSFYSLKLSVFFYLSTILFFTDLDTQILPNSMTYLLTSLGLLFFMIEGHAVMSVIG